MTPPDAGQRASETEAVRGSARARLASTPSIEPGPAGRQPPFDRIRLVRDARAAALTAALGATAATIGPNIYFSPKAPGLDTAAGRELLAHELIHTVQQHRFGARVQLFTAAEQPLIAKDLAAMMAVVEAIVNASSNGDDVSMGSLVRHAGGFTAGAALPGPLKSDEKQDMSMLTLRYLFTRRCGLIDMRHFFQLTYISWFFNTGPADIANRGATKKGIEHELTSEPTSKFSPEDTTSNALGAWTATQLAGFPQKKDLIARIRETLDRCAPVSFDSLSAASQNTIVNFYAAQAPSGEPLNQNRTAVALIPQIPELANADRSFPFTLDTDDPNRATIAGTAFSGGAAGLTSDSEIGDFVDVQREEVLKAIPQDVRQQLCTRLMQGWVSDDDLDAFEKLYRLGDAAARQAIQAANPVSALMGGQRTRLRAIYMATP